MSNQRSFYTKRYLYIDSISTTLRNNLFKNSCQQKTYVYLFKPPISNIGSLNSGHYQVPLIFIPLLVKLAKYGKDYLQTEM